MAETNKDNSKNRGCLKDNKTLPTASLLDKQRKTMKKALTNANIKNKAFFWLQKHSNLFSF